MCTVFSSTVGYLKIVTNLPMWKCEDWCFYLLLLNHCLLSWCYKQKFLLSVFPLQCKLSHLSALCLVTSYVYI